MYTIKPTQKGTALLDDEVDGGIHPGDMTITPLISADSSTHWLPHTRPNYDHKRSKGRPERVGARQ